MAHGFVPIAMMGEQFNPMDSLAQTAQLQAAYQQNQLRAMQIAEMQRQTQEANAQRMAARNAATYAPMNSVTAPAQSIGGAMSENAPDGQPALTLPQRTYSAQGPQGADFRNQYISQLGQLGQGQMIPGAQQEFAQQDMAKAKLLQEQQKTVDEHNASLALAKKNTSEAGKFDADAQGKHIDMLGAAANALLQLPEPQAQAAYPVTVAMLQSQGVDTSKFPPQFDRNIVGQAAQMAVSAKEQLQLKMEQQKQASTQQHQQNEEALTKRGQDITIRGQNMTDARAAKTAGVPYAQMNPQDQQLVDQIGQGKMAMNNLDRILTKNPGLMAAVSEKYPDFDSSKIKSYTQSYRDFTGAGKYGTQLNAGSTAMRHFAQLRDINDNNATTVRIAGTAANKAYNNLLDTVAGEVATFYGMPKTNETLAGIKGTLGGLTNRDAAIQEQARAMGEKFDELENTWQNAAPSKAYQAPMPGYSDAAKQARAKLDPEYAKRLQGAPAGSNPPASAGSDPFAQFGGVKH